MAQQGVTRARQDREPVQEDFAWNQPGEFHAEFVAAEPKQKKTIIPFAPVRVVPDNEAERWLSLSMEALEGEW